MGVPGGLYSILKDEWVAEPFPYEGDIDFATARKKGALAGELSAFSSASQKLAGFLLPSIQRHWERGTENGKKKQAKPKTTDLPMPLTDL